MPVRRDAPGEDSGVSEGSVSSGKQFARGLESAPTSADSAADGDDGTSGSPTSGSPTPGNPTSRSASSGNPSSRTAASGKQFARGSDADDSPPA